MLLHHVLIYQAPINGTLGNCPSSLSSGMTCDFVCNAGAQLEGPGAGSPPACVATPCSYLSMVVHGGHMQLQ